MRGCAGLVKQTLSGSLPVMNSERDQTPRPLSHSRQPQQQQQQQQPQPQPPEEAANKRPIGRPKKDCYGLTIWWWGHLRGAAAMHRGIGAHEGEAVRQGEDVLKEGVGVEEDQRLRMQSRLKQPSS